MSDLGYCLAYRNSWTHPAFRDLREAAIWNFLYQNAFWKDGQRQFNGYTFELKRGQIVISMRFIAKGFGMTEKGARVVIQKLEKLGMVVIQGATKGTIVTICNYDKYQLNEKTEGDQQGKPRANKGRTKGANKNEGKKERKNKVIKKEDFIAVPSFINSDIWLEWVKHRSEIKKKLTPTQSDAQIKKLGKWHDAGHDVNQILQNSISNGWTGLFEPKQKTAKKGSVDDELQQFLDR